MKLSLEKKCVWESLLIVRMVKYIMQEILISKTSLMMFKLKQDLPEMEKKSLELLKLWVTPQFSLDIKMAPLLLKSTLDSQILGQAMNICLIISLRKKHHLLPGKLENC